MSTKYNRSGILLESGTNEVEFLVVMLSTQRYGINVSKIRTIQVFEPEKVSPIPKQSEEILGLMTFRESTISVIDLTAQVFGKRQEVSNKRLLVVTEFNKRTTGYVVDAVDRIERCSWSQFEPITDSSCDKNVGLILGTVKVQDNLVLILDMESMLASLDPSMSMESYAEGIESSNIDRSKINILHCDDSILIQKLLYKVLTEAGFQSIIQFNNGEELLGYLKNNDKEDVNVILSDIEMPKMDGLTLCKNIRKDEKVSKIPLIFFSSMINQQMEAKCKSVGGNLCYSKPEINLIVKGIEQLVAETL